MMGFLMIYRTSAGRGHHCRDHSQEMPTVPDRMEYILALTSLSATSITHAWKGKAHYSSVLRAFTLSQS